MPNPTVTFLDDTGEYAAFSVDSIRRWRDYNTSRQYMYSSERPQLSVEEQQAIANEVLEKLEIIEPLAVVAGGAPRDWWHEKPARDLDFFTNDRVYMSDSEICDWLSKALGTSVYRKGAQYQGTGKRCFAFVKGGIECDIVMSNAQIAPENMVEKFNFSFNRCFYDKDGVHTTTAFDMYTDWGIILADEEVNAASLAKYGDYLKGNDIYTNMGDALDAIAAKMKGDTE